MKLLLFFLSFFITSTLLSQTEDREYFKSNKICEVTTSLFLDSKLLDNESFLQTTYINKYDLNGNNIKSLTFDEENNLLWDFEYEYDKQNKLISITENGKKEILRNCQTIYNDKNDIIEEFDETFNCRYYYDSLNRISKKVHINQETKETKEILFKYDDNGNKIAEYVEGTSFYLNEFLKYNSNNQITEKEIYYHLGTENELFQKIIYEYNDNKQMVSKKFVDGYAKENDVEYSYYENGKVKSTTTNDSSSTYFYNGNLISKVEKVSQKPFNMTIVELYEYKFCE